MWDQDTEFGQLGGDQPVQSRIAWSEEQYQG